jgi:crotonobetainyl-CoA:carnitine CoA-transferase CaiB-like acyl-CoA transferase
VSPPGPDRDGALAGLLVLELAGTLAGEMAGGLLADLGATVVKLEPPGGSPMRRRGPAAPGEADSLYFQVENRGKLSVEARLDRIAAEPWLGRLLELADGLVEDLGPGRLEAAGLGPAALEARSPRLSMLRLSPFGQTGPLAGLAGDDRIAQAFANVQFTTGFPDRPPVPVTVPIAECWSALLGASGLLMAVLHARRSGRGQVVDLALYETALRLQETVVVRHQRLGEVAQRQGTEAPSVAPAGIFRTRDEGWLALSGAGDQPFARLCQAMGVPEAVSDPRFATGASRLEHRAEANRMVADWVARHDLVEAETLLAEAGVPAAAVRSVDEILADPHLRARQALVPLRSPDGREFLVPAAVPRLTRTPARPAAAAPRAGEHTAAVRAWAMATPPPPAPAPTPAAAGPGPLAGLRVLDLSQWLAGPAAAALLGDFGAEVTMIELPPGAGAPAERPIDWVVTNRSKRSRVLDVRAPEGRAAFLELARAADVVIENFRPGTLERWRLGPAALLGANPRLVLVRCSGFGQTGPARERAAFNPVGLAVGGMTYLNGWPDRPPLRDGVIAGDYTTALFNVLGTLAALLRRERDGAGQVVDTAMCESVLRLSGDLVPARMVLGLRRERQGGPGPLHPHAMTLAAAGGRWVAVSPPGWEELAAGLEGLGLGRPADAAEAARRLAAFAGARSAPETAEALRRAGLPASPVNSVAELVAEPHLWARENLVRLRGTPLGEILVQGVVPRLSRTPGRVGPWPPAPGVDAPALSA